MLDVVTFAEYEDWWMQLNALEPNKNQYELKSKDFYWDDRQKSTKTFDFQLDVSNVLNVSENVMFLTFISF